MGERLIKKIIKLPSLQKIYIAISLQVIFILSYFYTIGHVPRTYNTILYYIFYLLGSICFGVAYGKYGNEYAKEQHAKKEKVTNDLIDKMNKDYEDFSRQILTIKNQKC